MNDSLASWGWTDSRQRQFAALVGEGLRPGRVARNHRGHLKLQTTDGLLDARTAGRLGADGPQRPVVGDWVAYRPSVADSPGVVEAVLERRTKLSRKVAGARAVEQVVAANVDLVLIVMGLDGDYNLRRLERLLVMAEESGAHTAVVLNKVDVCDDLALRLGEVRGLCAGRPVVAVSALAGDLEALELLLEPRQTVALIGSSGVGKSTLINGLRGDDALRTRAVREHDSRGRHTTTHRELFRLPGGALIIDNPGIREIQLWSAEKGLTSVFADIDEIAGDCRFNDCTHRHEPGCAVRAAVQAGTLEDSRLDNWHGLQAETEALERRKDARAQREHERKLHRLYRRVQREKRDRQK